MKVGNEKWKHGRLLKFMILRKRSRGQYEEEK